MDDTPTKRCAVCRQARPLAEFHRQSKSPDGRQSRCKPCAVALAMQWNKDHPERFRRNQRTTRLRREYGITHEDYETMLARQKGRCAICRKPPAAGKRLHIDHDHDTGRVRGLLCMPCNSFLGKIGEDVTTLKRAVAYLARHTPTLFG